MEPLKLLLVRDTFGADFTFGKLYADGQYVCDTLEDTDRHLETGGEKIYGKTAIPTGTYKVDITLSNRFKKLMPIFYNVPGFEGIRIHTGNTALDTDGCILCGTWRHGNTLRKSAAAFAIVMEVLQDAIAANRQIYIEVTRK
jgi:hypothetical protein